MHHFIAGNGIYIFNELESFIQVMEELQEAYIEHEKRKEGFKKDV